VVSHPIDLPLIPIIKDHIKILAKIHHTHKVVLARSFNRNIHLVGYLHDDILQTPNQEEKDWTQFMQGRLHPIHDNENFSQHGGQNYTSISIIDGFYTNIPLHTSPKCQTLSNQNQNSNHYPINLTFDSLQLARKSHKSTKYQPKITYPIS
jgi:hypothetical protein